MIVFKRCSRLCRESRIAARYIPAFHPFPPEPCQPASEKNSTPFGALSSAAGQEVRRSLAALLGNALLQPSDRVAAFPAKDKDGFIDAHREVSFSYMQAARRLDIRNHLTDRNEAACHSSVVSPPLDGFRTWQRLLSIESKQYDDGISAPAAKPRVQQPVEESRHGEAEKNSDASGKETLSSHGETARNWGWTWQEVASWPNLISLARMASGPPLALLVVHDHMGPALVGLALAGASDWLDGYVARRCGVNSVLGSYLDPLADKVLISCVAVALLLRGLLPGWLVVLTVGRDLALLGGAFLHRARSLQWQWRSGGEFFHVGADGAEIMQPLLISKVNTVLQLALMGSALLEAASRGGTPPELLPLLSYAVGATTCLSGAAYAAMYVRRARKAGAATSPRPS